MSCKITGSANGEIIATDASTWLAWVAQIGGYLATNVNRRAHIDSRFTSADETWRSAAYKGQTLYVVEPDEPAERLGQVRTGRILAGFWL